MRDSGGDRPSEGGGDRPPEGGGGGAPRLVVVMGVSGAGKSAVGAALAAAMGWAFIEGDAHHPAVNVDKMRAGVPLTDADRAPWLSALRAEAAAASAAAPPGGGAVLACSALKPAYRAALAVDGAPPPAFVLLDVPPGVLEARVAARAAAGGHFMPPSLLASQLAALEVRDGDLLLRVGAEPGGGAFPPVREIVGRIAAAVASAGRGG